MAKMDREEETDMGVLGGGLLHVCDLPLLGLLGSPVVASRACVVKGGGCLAVLDLCIFATRRSGVCLAAR